MPRCKNLQSNIMTRLGLVPEVSPGIHAVRLDQRVLPGGPLYKDQKSKVKSQNSGVASRPLTDEPLIQRRSLGEWIKSKLRKTDDR